MSGTPTRTRLHAEAIIWKNLNNEKVVHVYGLHYADNLSIHLLKLVTLGTIIQQLYVYVPVYNFDHPSIS